MPEDRIAQMKAAHEVLCEFPFKVKELAKGYADRTLRIDLATGEIKMLPVSQQMKDLWIGGKGFDLWLMFQEINRESDWDSPENPICFSSGPLGGTTSFPGSGKTLVTTISPLTHSIMDCNVGGYFGPFLKFAGFDALCIVGQASEETVIFIDAVNEKITLEKAPLESLDAHVLSEELTEMYADDDLDKRNIAVVSAGSAAEHARMGVLNFSFWDWRRQVARMKQAGRGGVGTVFRHKKIKALVVKNRDITPAWRVAESKVAKLVSPKTISTHACHLDIAEIDQIIDKWGVDPEYVIEMMQDIQDRFRHISVTAIDRLCERTGVPRAYLYHIATFYKTFSLEEKGKTVIQVCMGTTCHVKGSARILDSFERELGIKTGQTTADKAFTLEAVACLGACSIAPVVKMGEQVFGNVQAKDVARLLKSVETGKAV
jgi:NADH:ubiquinone oxidoreductase subunit E